MIRKLIQYFGFGPRRILLAEDYYSTWTLQELKHIENCQRMKSYLEAHS